MRLIVNNKKILIHGFSSYLPTKRKSYTNKYAIVVEFFTDKTLTGYEKEKVSCAIEKLLKSDALDLFNRQQAEIERLQSILLRFMDEVSKWEEKYGLDVSELPLIPICDEGRDIIDRYRSQAIKQFAERFLKTVHDNHYVLVDQINSKDYGMFTIGIEQAVDETKKGMVGEE